MTGRITNENMFKFNVETKCPIEENDINFFPPQNSCWSFHSVKSGPENLTSESKTAPYASHKHPHPGISYYLPFLQSTNYSLHPVIVGYLKLAPQWLKHLLTAQVLGVRHMHKGLGPGMLQQKLFRTQMVVFLHPEAWQQQQGYHLGTGVWLGCPCHPEVSGCFGHGAIESCSNTGLCIT